MTAELPRDLAARRLYITTRLANELVDELDQLERQLLGGLLDQARLRGRVDDIARLACAVHDELAELELP